MDVLAAGIVRSDGGIRQEEHNLISYLKFGMLKYVSRFYFVEGARTFFVGGEVLFTDSTASQDIMPL